MTSLLSDSNGSCILGFVDNCNHIHENLDESYGFNTYPLDGYMIFRVPGTYKAGKEFNYQYQKDLNSYKTVLNYGFYYKENIHKDVDIYMKFHKAHLTQQKFQIVKELKLLKEDEIKIYEEFFKHEEKEYIFINLPFNRNVEPGFLKILKLYTFLGTNMPISEVKTRLFADIPLDYNSEILSSALFRTTIYISIKEEEKLKLSLVNILF
jgi:hypothetical protein